jgi:predicted metal-dependent hydrolase
LDPSFHDHLAKGVELFNRQEFYEAHEAWEAGWVDELADERLLLQGLIQIAAGFYKLQVGAPVGTVKLLDEGMKKCRRFLEDAQGVDLSTLLPEVELWLANARALVAQKRADYDPTMLPRISYRRRGDA